jgi:hypothetical protein
MFTKRANHLVGVYLRVGVCMKCLYSIYMIERAWGVFMGSLIYLGVCLFFYGYFICICGLVVLFFYFIWGFVFLLFLSLGVVAEKSGGVL